MLLTMTYHDVHRKIDDQPFKPFGIKLVNNTTYDITEPWMVIIGESSAIVVTQTRVASEVIELHWTGERFRSRTFLSSRISNSPRKQSANAPSPTHPSAPPSSRVWNSHIPTASANAA
jgi:hypothetical protein